MPVLCIFYSQQQWLNEFLIFLPCLDKLVFLLLINGLALIQQFFKCHHWYFFFQWQSFYYVFNCWLVYNFIHFFDVYSLKDFLADYTMILQTIISPFYKQLLKQNINKLDPSQQQNTISLVIRKQMKQNQQSSQTNHKIHYKSLYIEYKPINLTLHRNFTTAHSTSSTRVNFFIRVGSERPQVYMKTQMYGFGQAGLPPKKPGCYMADVQDCLQFMNKLKQDIFIMSQDKNQPNEIQDEYLMYMPNYLKQKLKNDYKTSIRKQIFSLINFIQKYSNTQHYRPAKCALQFALIDLFSRYHHITVTNLLINQQQNGKHPYSFYTASLESNQKMLQNIREHLNITKYIKLKYNHNIPALLDLLTQLSKDQTIMGEKDNQIQKIIIDANCSWKCQHFDEFVKGIKQISSLPQKILYIEQPFDLQITNIQEWVKIKQSSPFKILADQSFRNQHDIQKVKRVAHAVNIKTQKAGGAFATLKSALMAKQQGLQIMFGSMCSTQLGSTQTFQFWPLAQYLDVDGSLLVKQPVINGGFQWKEKGQVVPVDSLSKEMTYGLKIDGNCLFQF